MGPWLRLLWELFASALAPPLCAACEQPVPMLTAFCTACAATLERARPESPSLVAPFFYGGALARALARFKYEGHPELARPLSAAIVRAIPAALSVDLVVPVPLHPARLAARGYNQATLLARPVARALGVPLAAAAMERTRDTSQQALLDRQARLANLTGAFVVAEPGRLAGRRVLLVDDVRTTGATLRACERVLRSEGADVVGAVVARAV
jgi:ComF family protein